MSGGLSPPDTPAASKPAKPKKPAAVKAAKPAPAKPDYTAEFEFFWQAYPRRTAKFGAAAAFTRARRTTSAAEIMAGLARYAFSDQPKYQPMPATWLNQGRWLDEVAAAKSAIENDPADPWGARAWAALLPDVKPGTINGATVLALNGYDVVAVACDICAAAQLPARWRGALNQIAVWLRDDLDPDMIVVAIRSSYQPMVAGNWKFYDKRVRDFTGNRKYVRRS